VRAFLKNEMAEEEVAKGCVFFTEFYRGRVVIL
jgi:hypothetical protein